MPGLARVLARRGIHFGWVVAGVTFLTMLATAAAMGMPGVLMVPLEQEFGWSAAQISGALALRLLLYGVMGPFSAALLARFGLRATVAAALGLIVAGLGLATQITALWELWLCWGVLVGFGTGMTAMVLGAYVANRWFVRRRGLVMGLLTASAATGQLVFLPAAAWLAQHVGWRWAMLPAVGACAAACLLMLIFGADHPADVDLPAYGEAGVVARTRPGNPVRTALDTFAEASRNRVFWILFGTFFICGLSTNGLIQTHFIPLCHDFGIPEVQAASVLAAMGMFDFIGTIGSGWLSDRYDSRWLLAWYYGLRGLSLLFLPSSSFTFYGLSLFAVFYGLDWIATVPPTVKLAAGAFGRERAAVVFGWVFMGHQLGAAVAAYGGGLSRSELSSYLPAFYTAGVFCLIAAAAALWARPRRAARLRSALAG
ncbi:MAG: MFS transporter [Acidisphaera sp.]|nr:MFS transporter [Acidisphaera sp.]